MVRNIFFLSIFISQISFSQIGEFGISLDVANLQGEFRENVKRPGIGLGMNGIYYLPSIPSIGVGAHLGFLNYGSVEDKIPFPGTFGTVNILMNRQNNILVYQLLAKISPHLSVVNPYIEIFGGGHNLSTQTSLKSEFYNNNNEPNEIARSENSSDNVLSYGFGLGGEIKISSSYITNDLTLDSTSYDLFLNFGFKMIRGGIAKYLTEDAVKGIDANNNPIYDFKKSRTDFSIIQIGASFVF